jgi:nucleoside 2-deoxyribosyltransferase
MKRRVYVAGPMCGYENLNFDAFDKAQTFLTEQGYFVISPADLDRTWEDWGLYPPKDFVPSKEKKKEMILRDIKAILSCDAIYVLKGWEHSKGSAVETALAKFLDLEIIYEQ